jgi:hypothetical protein
MVDPANVRPDANLREGGLQVRNVFPVRDRVQAVQAASLCKKEGSGAHGGGDRNGVHLPTDPVDDGGPIDLSGHEAPGDDQAIQLGVIIDRAVGFKLEPCAGLHRVTRATDRDHTQQRRRLDVRPGVQPGRRCQYFVRAGEVEHFDLVEGEYADGLCHVGSVSVNRCRSPRN